MPNRRTLAMRYSESSMPDRAQGGTDRKRTVPEFRVPSSLVPILPKLASLKAGAVKDLVEALTKTPPRASHDAYTSAVKQSLRRPFPEVDRVLDALISLSIGRDYVAASSAAFAESVAHADGLRLTSRQRQVLKTRLVQFLRCESLAITAKIGTLAIELSNVVIDTRIVTDLRPIFGEEVGKGPRGSLITHTLRIHHLDARQQHVTVGFAFDSDDLAKLRRVLDRAEDKEKRLKELLSRSHVELFELEDED